MKILKFIMAFAVLLVFAFSAVSAYEYSNAEDSNTDGVGIAPSPVDGTIDIYAVLNYDVDTPIYTWEKNGIESSYTGSSIPASALSDDDQWAVTVSYMEYVGGYVGYIEIELGTETITVQSSEDNNEGEGLVYILPNPAYEDEDITCYSTFDLGSSTPIHTWEENGVEIDELSEATVDESYLDAGEEWTCTVSYLEYVGWPIGYIQIDLGSDTVEILEREAEEDGNTAPRVADIHFTVEEGDLVDVDLVQYSSFGSYFTAAIRAVTFQTQDVPAYDADGYTLAIIFSLPLNLGSGQWQTEVGDAGVYDVLAYVGDGENIEEVSIEITVEAAEVVVDAEAPLAADIHFTVEEGDLVDVDLVQYSSFGSYFTAAIRAVTFQTQDVPAYDADGYTLAIIFSLPLNLGSGQWQTEVGDAGVYDVLAYVGDGENIEEVSIEITVEAAEVVVDAEAPLATDIHFTVTEGDLADVEIVYTNNYATYLLANYVNIVYERTNIYVYDADSVESELSYSFSSPLDVNGDWQTVVGDEGGYIADFTVTDAEGNTGSTTVSITVEAAEDTDGDNTAPVLEDIADIEINEGGSLSVTAVATDADGDALSYSYSAIPGGSVSGSTWAWTTSYSDAGQYDVAVSVSDGLASDSTSFTVKVNDVDIGEEEVHRSDYEGDLLTVDEIRVLNADSLYSAYDVSDMDLKASGVFYVDDGYLQSTGSDNEIKVYLAMHNRNSFDADDISVTFIFDGEEYKSSFSDLDRSEEEARVYTIAIPEDLETGKYALRVLVESDDVSYEKAFNLNIVSLGDYIVQPIAEDGSVREAVTSLKEKVKDFLSFLF